MSDLCHVVDFLVENAFLTGVEVKPGDAEDAMIVEEVHN